LATIEKNPPTDIQAAREAALKYLRLVRIGSAEKESGAFPYIQGGEVSLEATAWALIALRHDRDLAIAGLKYLSRSQNSADGGWSTRPGAGRSDWTSGPALLAMRILHQLYKDEVDAAVNKALSRGLSYLLDSRVEFYGPTARLALLFSKGPAGLEYGRGWPWDPKCFHWLEPTAYCLLALKVPTAAAQGADDEAIIKFADRFILEHSCQGGGWNHGNDLSLGVYLPPYRLTTAEALLGLQIKQDPAGGKADKTGAQTDERSKKIEAGLNFLKSQTEEDSSSLSLAASILALSAYDQPFQAELAYLLKRQASNGSFGPSVMSTALASIALEAGQPPDKDMNKDRALILKIAQS
jgi:hypothetical protein